MPGGRWEGYLLKMVSAIYDETLPKFLSSYFWRLLHFNLVKEWSKQKNKYRKDISMKGNLDFLFLQFSTQAT